MPGKSRPGLSLTRLLIYPVPCGALTVIGVGTLPGYQEADRKETVAKNKLGKILKQRRGTIPLTLDELARASGVSPTYLGRIERGNRFPSARVLRKITKPLGFSESYLFTFAGYLSPQASNMVEREVQLGRLNPDVAKALSEEPVEIQRAMLAILWGVKHIAKHIAKDSAQGNSGNSIRGMAGAKPLSENPGQT